MLRGGLTGAAALGLATSRVATAGTGQAPGGSRIGTEERDDVAVLLSRITNGITEEELALARSLGYQAYLEQQLDWENIDDSETDRILESLPSIHMTAEELAANYGFGGNTFVPVKELRAARLIRAVCSKRQLHERMVEFWSDHFNVDYTEITVRWFKTVEDREVVRPNALGRFRTLLEQDARSAAMSVYLNNDESTAGNINENYGREIMELHTLGVDGPYTETDVVEVSRCFTGWRYKQLFEGEFGAFHFDDSAHDSGPKTVLGHGLPTGNGIQDGEFVLDLLARHPKTAHFVSRKLTSWLLVDDPQDDVVRGVADTFLATGGEVRQMVRAIFDRSSLARTRPWRNRKLKRPFQYVVGLLRQTGATFEYLEGVMARLRGMGHRPFDWPTPDGAPDTVERWGQGVHTRWSFAFDLVDGKVPGVTVPMSGLEKLQGGAPKSELAARLDQAMTAGSMAPRDVQRVQLYLDGHAVLTDRLLREAVAMTASAPSYSYF